MAKAIIMPRQGISVESCIITEWNIQVGDSVKVGDVIFSYETDKAAFEEESQVEGTVLALLRDEGEDVPCLETICVIGQPGEDISEWMTEKSSDEIVEDKPQEKVNVKPAQSLPSTAAQDGQRTFASPRARKLAQQADVDLQLAQASGPHGRIIEQDVARVIRDGVQAPEQISSSVLLETTDADYEDIPLSTVRKVIAKAMHISLSEMAQLTINASFDATAILTYRKKVKARSSDLGVNNITINDMILYAVAKTLLDHPDLNAHYLGDVIRQFQHVNLGVAVDAPRGLLVPTLLGADEMRLSQLSAASAEVIQSARSGSINPDLLTGGTFTVTNLGTMGVESFTPVINPPQTAILGVCAITQRVRANQDGQMEMYPAMGLSLTFDHRAVDGAPAARFLKSLCTVLENFNILLAK